MPISLEFSRPIWLWALPFVIVWLIAARWAWWRVGLAALPWRRSARPDTGRGAPNFGQRERAILRQELRRFGVRVAWCAVLIGALAGAGLVRPLTQQATIFVVDTSTSVAAARDQAEAAVRLATARLIAGDRVGVVAVAAEARVEESPTEKPLFARLTAAVAPNASDLAAGLRLAGAMLPEGYTGHVVLVSDGRQTTGDVVAAARELAGRGVAVDVLPIGAPVADVRLESVNLSNTAYRGEVSTLLIRVNSGVATTVTLRVYRDDAVLLERDIALRPGRQEIAVPAPVGDPGLHRYKVDLVTLDPTADQTPLNNALGAIQRVVGPPRVLIIAGRPEAAGWLPDALKASGVDVDVTRPAGAPVDLAGWARYDAIVLADTPAAALPSGAMDRIEQVVRDLGRGLIMTGGPDSFTPGGYSETPIERALPVHMDLRGRGRQPKVALALVLDKSGSMMGLKMDLTKEAAARSTRLLQPDDQVSVIAFDAQPYVVVPMQTIANREAIEAAIGGIVASGGTEIYRALVEGFEVVRRADADVRHVILMTDGIEGQGGDYGALLRQMRDARVTLSSVAVGDDSDTRLLEAVARAGRGRYHFTNDPKSIPEIFTQETVVTARTILVEERFQPAIASGGALLRGLTAAPALDGYVAVSPKDRAEVVLISRQGDPVLAAWQYGAGRAIAWTPDLTSRWSGGWANSASATTLWGNILSWLLPPRDSGDLAIAVDGAGDDRATISVETRANWNDVAPTQADLIGPDGERRTITLAPAGPGRYQATAATPAVGAYIVRATQSLSTEVTVRGETGWVAPYPAEYRETGPDTPLLARIAQAGDGKLLAEPVDAMRPAERPTSARWLLWPWLLIGAAVAWPLDIAYRRFAGVTRASTDRQRAPPATQSARPASAARPALANGATTTNDDEPPLPPAPASTAERLLQRQRASRERRRERVTSDQ